MELQMPKLHVGQGTHLGAICLFPVWVEDVPVRGLATGADAQVRVVEREGSPVVGELVLANVGAKPVLLVAGELFEGAGSTGRWTTTWCCCRVSRWWRECPVSRRAAGTVTKVSAACATGFGDGAGSSADGSGRATAGAGVGTGLALRRRLRGICDLFLRGPPGPRCCQAALAVSSQGPP